MKLIVCGSSSMGNCYLLKGDNESLIIEAGINIKYVKNILDYDISSVNGVCITHSHLDHAKYAKDYIKNGIDVYCSKGTAEALNIQNSHRTKILASEKLTKIGRFTVLPFDVIHDAENPLGFLINHPDTGNILFLTDSYFSEYIFKDLRHILLEVNYDETILEENVRSGRVHESMRHRIITNHMGLGTAIDLLAANDLSKVQNIILIHLSDTNSDENGFIDSIQKATGKTVKVASKNTVISLNKRPF